MEHRHSTLGQTPIKKPYFSEEFQLGENIHLPSIRFAIFNFDTQTSLLHIGHNANPLITLKKNPTNYNSEYAKNSNFYSY